MSAATCATWTTWCWCTTRRRTCANALWLCGPLRLEFNGKTQIAPLSQGIDFLGWHLYLTDAGKVVRRLRQSAKRSMLKKLRALDGLPPEARDAVPDSYLAHLAHGDAAGLARIIEEMGTEYPAETERHRRR